MKHIDFVYDNECIFSYWKLAALGAMLFVSIMGASAQTMAVSGRIDDESGKALTDVWVGIHGEIPATQTNSKGTYEIQVERGAVLEFALEGFQTYRTVIWDSPTIDRVLLTEQPLEEIETGYIRLPKRDVSSALASVALREIHPLPVQDVSHQLAGNVTGLAVQATGAPGQSAGIRIRGIQSFLATNPLYVVDGVPLPDADISFLNPQDIGSIQVLKDASASAIYGTRAANGVILISTRQGEADQFRIAYEGYAGTQTPVRGYDEILLQDPLEHGKAIWQRYETAGQTAPSRIFGSGASPILPEYLYPANPSSSLSDKDYRYPDNIIVRPNESGTNWWDAAFDPAMITSHNLSISGGNEPASFLLSANYFKQEGIMKHTGFDRYSVRANSQMKVGKFTLGENLLLARTSGVNEPIPANGGQSVMNQILRMSPIVPVYDVGNNFAGTLAGGLESVSNPLAALTRNRENRTNAYHVLGNIFAQYQLNDHISARTSFGLRFAQQQAYRFSYPNFEDLEPSAINRLEEKWATMTAGTWTNTLNFHKDFKNYSLNLMAGYESQFYSTRTIAGSMEGYISTHPNAWYLSGVLADEETRTVWSGGDKSSMASMFGRFDYGYKEKYVLTASIREDASSRFGTGIKGLFYGTSLAWRLSEEGFMDDMEWVEEFKVRVGYGLTGNMQVLPGAAFNQYGGGISSTYYDLNGTNNTVMTGFSVAQQGNPNLQWEASSTMNAGADLSLYGGKFSASFDYFETENSGLLFQAPLPGTAGSAAVPYSHTGAMKNTGFEVFAAYRGQINRNWQLRATLNLSQVKNEITRLDGQQEAVFGAGFDALIGNVQENRVGYPVNSFYGYVADGIFQNTSEVSVHAEQSGAAPGRLRFKDLNQDGTIDELDKGPIGSALPDLQGGLNLEVIFRNIDCSVSLYGSAGNQIFNYTKLFSDLGYQNANMSQEAYANSWNGENPYAQIPRLDASDTYSQQSSTWYVEDGSFLRIRNIQIGYTFPTFLTQGLGLNRLRVYVQAHNVMTLSGYSGLDPASAFSNLPATANRSNWGGYDMGNYPHAQMYLAGASISF